MNKKKWLIAIFIAIIIIIGIVIYIKTQNKKEIIIIEEKAEIMKICEYNNPIVPDGFKKIETESASWELEDTIPKGWNNGLVIEDEIGNQFVWVPVEDFYNEYKIGDMIDFIDREQAQIFQYGGFYVARYEAGVPEEYIEVIQDNEINIRNRNVSNIPTSKQGQIPWNFIEWDRANESAEKMYEKSNSVSSDLITANEWENILTWLKKSGFDIENSEAWGNFANSNFKFKGYYSEDGRTYKYAENKTKQTYNMLLSTGATERNKANNIYDLAGNLAEFIDVNETSSNKYVRGGYYDINSVKSADSKMDLCERNNREGFRVVLYQK